MWSFVIYRFLVDDPLNMDRVLVVAEGSGYPTEELALTQGRVFLPVDDERFGYKLFVREN